MGKLVSKSVFRLALTMMAIAGIGATPGSGGQTSSDQAATADQGERLQLARCEDDKPCPPLCGVRG